MQATLGDSAAMVTATTASTTSSSVSSSIDSTVSLPGCCSIAVGIDTVAVLGSFSSSSSDDSESVSCKIVIFQIGSMINGNSGLKESMKGLKAEFKEELKAVKSLVDHINGK